MIYDYRNHINHAWHNGYTRQEFWRQRLNNVKTWRNEAIEKSWLLSFLAGKSNYIIETIKLFYIRRK